MARDGEEARRGADGAVAYVEGRLGGDADERTEILRSREREEASINKELAAQLDALRADAMCLRRMVAENSLRHPVVFEVEPPPFDDGRVLRPPVSPAPGLSKTPKEARGRTWVHSGKLGNTRVFLTRRPSKATKRPGGQHPAATMGTRPSGASSSTLPVVERGRDAAAGLGFAGDYGCAHPGAGGTGGSPEDRGGAAAAADGAVLTDGEETWSCCGRTVEAAGRGCGSIEPSPKPKDLLLDVMDPRSRLGRPLDFRDFLPGFAWAGLTMDPVSFSKSSDDGAFRPRTAPERLEQNQPNGSSSRSGGDVPDLLATELRLRKTHADGTQKRVPDPAATRTSS